MTTREDLAAAILGAMQPGGYTWLAEKMADAIVTHDILKSIRAEAWDEGFDAGERDVFQHHETGWDGHCIKNPYREETPDVQ